MEKCRNHRDYISDRLNDDPFSKLAREYDKAFCEILSKLSDECWMLEGDNHEYPGHDV